MDRHYFIANLKSHFTTQDSENYFEELKKTISNIDTKRNTLIFCPSFTLLELFNRKKREMNLPISIGAQNVSSFGEGAYTGEVFAGQLQNIAEYVIIGHSERKRYNHESDEDVMKKADLAKNAGLMVIQCIQDENSLISDKVDMIAYEPPSAISTFGTGTPDDPEDVERVLEHVSKRAGGKILIYGGSVNPETIKNYSSIRKCSGFLVGSASLNASEFLSLTTSW